MSRFQRHVESLATQALRWGVGQLGFEARRRVAEILAGNHRELRKLHRGFQRRPRQIAALALSIADGSAVEHGPQARETVDSVALAAWQQADVEVKEKEFRAFIKASQRAKLFECLSAMVEE
jgi:hypothetical protein